VAQAPEDVGDRRPAHDESKPNSSTMYSVTPVSTVSGLNPPCTLEVEAGWARTTSHRLPDRSRSQAAENPANVTVMVRMLRAYHGGLHC
jgi:hypothetical protein